MISKVLSLHFEKWPLQIDFQKQVFNRLDPISATSGVKDTSSLLLDLIMLMKVIQLHSELHLNDNVALYFNGGGCIVVILGERPTLCSQISQDLTDAYLTYQQRRINEIPNRNAN